MQLWCAVPRQCELGLFHIWKGEGKIEVSKAALARDRVTCSRSSSSTASVWRELTSICWLHAAFRLLAEKPGKGAADPRRGTHPARHGLNAGVDSSLANADVSNARMALPAQRTMNRSRLISSRASWEYLRRSSVWIHFCARIPAAMREQPGTAQHPVWILPETNSRSDEQAGYFKHSTIPLLCLGVFQGRGSGFTLPTVFRI